MTAAVYALFFTLGLVAGWCGALAWGMREQEDEA